MIRSFTPNDVKQVKEIHEKYFKEEFEFPDFLQNFICAFVITDEDSNNIIAAGGVRTLAELIAITNKDYSPRIRRKSLYELLSAGMYIAEKSNHDSLHAFIQDPLWLHMMKQRGFHETVGKSLYIGVK